MSVSLPPRLQTRIPRPAKLYREIFDCFGQFDEPRLKIKLLGDMFFGVVSEPHWARQTGHFINGILHEAARLIQAFPDPDERARLSDDIVSHYISYRIQDDPAPLQRFTARIGTTVDQEKLDFEVNRKRLLEVPLEDLDDNPHRDMVLKLRAIDHSASGDIRGTWEMIEAIRTVSVQAKALADARETLAVTSFLMDKNDSLALKRMEQEAAGLLSGNLSRIGYGDSTTDRMVRLLASAFYNLLTPDELLHVVDRLEWDASDISSMRLILYQLARIARGDALESRLRRLYANVADRHDNDKMLLFLADCAWESRYPQLVEQIIQDVRDRKPPPSLGTQGVYFESNRYVLLANLFCIARSRNTASSMMQMALEHAERLEEPMRSDQIVNILFAMRKIELKHDAEKLFLAHDREQNFTISLFSYCQEHIVLESGFFEMSPYVWEESGSAEWLAEVYAATASIDDPVRLAKVLTVYWSDTDYLSLYFGAEEP